MEAIRNTSVHDFLLRWTEQKIPSGTIVKPNAQNGHCSDRKILQLTVCTTAKKAMAVHSTLFSRNSESEQLAW